MSELSSQADTPVTVTFRMAGDTVETAAGPEAGETFKAEIEYLHPFVLRLGQVLRMRTIDYGVFRENDSWVGFRFRESGEGEVAEANGLVSTAPVSLGAILEALKDGS